MLNSFLVIKFCIFSNLTVLSKCVAFLFTSLSQEFILYKNSNNKAVDIISAIKCEN